MNKKIVVCLLCLLLFSQIVLPQTTGNKPKNNFSKLNQDPILDRIITLIMKIGHFPSLSSCIINDDQVVWSKAYGYYNLEENKSTTINTKYMACSISKTITGMALMQLYDQGLFELDDDVNNFLPFNLRNPHFPNDTITFRMLLAHSSSINRDPISFYWLNYSADPPITWYPYPWIEEYIVPGGSYYVPEIWNDRFRPGERAQYANANFVLIAYLVEVMSENTFIDYCNENIFIPLEIKEARFNLADINLSEVAVPYQYFQGDYLKITELNWAGNPPGDIYYRMLHYPVGGLYISAMDLSHFLVAHMNDGEYNGTRIISKDTLDEMHHNQPPLSGYGLAWYYSSTIYGWIFSGHEGDIPGYHNSMFMQHNNFENGVIFFITGDRYTAIGRNMALLVRNILFIRANIISRISINEIENSNEIIDIFNNPVMPSPLYNLLRNELAIKYQYS
jgi:CubicO group peptidase (beta-lactamase class C family)